MMDRTRAATLGLLAPAALALGMSADTSYRFLGAALQITNEWERALLCGVAEAAIVALTVYAWATRTKGPAYLAYAAVLVQAIPAFKVSGGAGGPIRVILGPVLLAVMLHLLLGLELRMSGDRREGILGAALREIRERLTAFLGIGRRGADSAAIARSRAADRAVNLADVVAAAKPGSRKHGRRAAKLAAAIDGARHGLERPEADTAEAAIVSRVVRRKSVAGLATIETRHDWTATLPAPRHDTDRDTATTPVATDRDTLPVLSVSQRQAASSQDRNDAPEEELTQEYPDVIMNGAHGSIVYFAVMGNRVKIGTTTNLSARMESLALPRECVKRTVPGGQETEAKYHERFMAYRIGTSEWFRREGALLSFLQSAPLSVVPVNVESGQDTAIDTRPATATPDTTPVAAPVAAVIDGGASVAQMVREAMQTGIADRDTVLARVRQVRPDVSRQTVARAMQRQGSRMQGTGQYM